MSTELLFSILVILFLGFKHAFETDHLLAVSTIVSRRNNLWKSIKDGMYWGIGHTSTLFFVAFIVLLIKFKIPEKQFQYLDAMVGFFLIYLGFYRLFTWYKTKKGKQHPHEHKVDVHNLQQKNIKKTPYTTSHFPAYSIGLLHGLAGSGELIIAAMIKMKTVEAGLYYLITFGIGSVFGMMTAAGLFSLPYSKRVVNSSILQIILIFTTSILSICYGSYWLFHNAIL